jgi:peptidyl-prolyl cis-trans isomerase C
VRTLRMSATLLVASLATVSPATVLFAAADDAPVAARVNGAAITSAQVDKLAQRMAAAQGSPPDAAKQEALQSLIDIEVITQQAKVDKIEAPTAEVDQHLNELKGRYPSPEAFQQALAANQATEAELRSDLTRTTLVQKVLDKHVTVTLAPDAAEQFYKANTDKFKHDAEVRVSHILFAAPPDGDGSAAQEHATAALARLKKGENFGTLAKELSDDPASKANGGDLGFMGHDGAIKEFTDAAFALKPGETSDVVHTKFGYHIIKVTETRPAGVTPLAEVKSELDDFLRDQERDKQLQAYVEGLKKLAKIEIVAPNK